MGAILNARPLVSLSADPDEPAVLSPPILLTHKPLVLDPQLPEFEFKDAFKSRESLFIIWRTAFGGDGVLNTLSTEATAVGIK